MSSDRRITITREIDIARTPRLIQVEGLFDISPAKNVSRKWDFTLPLDEKSWNIGLILGPSGSGKSTILSECFAPPKTFEWSKTKSIVDGFPSSFGIKDVTSLLNAVGFSSPPSWLKPFHILSNGEKFRVNLARLLSECDDQIVIDEFTSVVDRIVAKVGSCAIAKTIRAKNTKFIAASCHYDIVDWLQPDWILEPDQCRFQWRSLQRRPPIELEICRVYRSAWNLFRAHHYLNHDIHIAAKCFVAFYNGTPIAFEAILPFPHRSSPGWRAHRIVTLPDYQGIGIGTQLSNFIASAVKATGKRFRIRTSAPGLRAYSWKSKSWVCITRFGFSGNHATNMQFPSSSRTAETFEYVGPALDRERAEKLLS